MAVLLNEEEAVQCTALAAGRAHVRVRMNGGHWHGCTCAHVRVHVHEQFVMRIARRVLLDECAQPVVQRLWAGDECVEVVVVVGVGVWWDEWLWWYGHARVCCAGCLVLSFSLMDMTG